MSFGLMTSHRVCGRCYVKPSVLAIAAAAAGIEDKAIRHAREAFEIRDPGCQIYFSKHFPDSARLRGELPVGWPSPSLP
jgi:hypothetical protein